MDPTAPLGARRGIATQVEVREHESGSHSVLLVNTLDRPGLLTGGWLCSGFGRRDAPCAAVRSSCLGSSAANAAVIAAAPPFCSFILPDLLLTSRLPASDYFTEHVFCHSSFLPFLSADIVRVLKDVSLNVVSAEVDTVGRNAIDRFNIT